ncbi:MAG: phage tail tape measure protein [Bacteroidia bacterium]|nr:phage tail tape measure protein [Bacteroidia bacterium]
MPEVDLKIEIGTAQSLVSLKKLETEVSQTEKATVKVGKTAASQFKKMEKAVNSSQDEVKLLAFRLKETEKTLKKAIGSSDRQFKKMSEAANDSKNEVKRLEKEIKKTGKTTDKTTKKGAKGFNRLSKAIGSAKTQLLGFVTLASGALIFKSAIQNASAFETGLVGVAKTTGITGKELEELERRIGILSRTIPVTTEELLALAQSAGQLGVSGTDDILKFTETIAKLGRASNLQGEEAAQTLARILNVTGESIGSVDVFASVIVAVGNEVAATEKQIARITNEIARSTALFNVSAADSAALGAAMVAMGARAESAGSAVGRAFQEIQNRVTLGGEELKEFAKALEIDGDVLARTFSEDKIAGFRILLEGLRDLGETKAGAALAKVGLGGQEIIKTLGPLSANLEQYTKTQMLANKEVANAVALQKEYAASAATFDAAFKLLGNNVSAISKAFGDQFLDGFTESLKDLNTTLSTFIDNEKELDATIKATIGGLELFGNLLLTGGAIYIGLKAFPIIMKAWPIAVATATGAMKTLALFTGFAQVAGVKFALSTIPWNQALFGVSIKAGLASTAISKLSLATGVLSAAFVGFQVGSYLYSLEVVRGTTAHAIKNMIIGYEKLKVAIAKTIAFTVTLGGTTGDYATQADFLDKQLLKVIKEETATVKAMIDGAEATTNARKSADEYTKGLNKLKAELKAVKDETKDKTKATVKLQDAEQELLDILFPLEKAQKDYNKDLILLNTTFKKLDKEGTSKHIAAQKALKQEYIKLFPVLEAYEGFLTRLFEFEETKSESTKKLLETLFPLKLEQKEYNEELELLKEHYKGVTDGTDQYAQAVLALKKEHVDLFPEIKKQMDAAEDLADSWDDAAERIDESFAKAWEGAFDSFEDFTDSILGSFKKLLAELAHQSITNPILIQLGLGASGGVTGALSAAGGGAGGGGLLGGVSALASAGLSKIGLSKLAASGVGGFTSATLANFGISGVFNRTADVALAGIANDTLISTLPGGGTASIDAIKGSTIDPSGGFSFDPVNFAATIGASYAGGKLGNAVGENLTGKQANSAIGQTIGTLAGSFAGPIGSFIGATIGSFVDVLFGGGVHDPKITVETTDLLPKSLNEHSSDDFNVVTESQFGGIRALSQHDTFRGASDRAIKSFGDFFEGIAELEDVIASTLTETQIGKIKTAVEKQKSTISEELNTTDFITERFQTIFNTIGGEVDEIFDALSESVIQSGDEIIGVIDQISLAALSMENASDDFKTYLDNIDQLTIETFAAGGSLEAVNQVLSKLGDETLSLDKAGADAAQSMISLQGSLEDFIVITTALQNDLGILSSSLFGDLQSRIDTERDRLTVIHDAANDLFDIEMKRYEESIAASDKLKESIADVFLVGASASEAFEFNQNKYEELLARANTGDANAANDLASFSSTFLESAQTFFASSSAFKDIKSSVLSDLNSVSSLFDSSSAPNVPNESLTSGRLESLLAQQIEESSSRTSFDQALFVQSLLELNLATGTDIDTLLSGLGLNFQDVKGAFVNAIKDSSDLNKDGIVSAIEIQNTLLNTDSPLYRLLVAGNANTSSISDLGTILSTIDSNSDNNLTLQELISSGILPAQAAEIIRLVDANADGRISPLELTLQTMLPGGGLFGLFQSIATGIDSINFPDINAQGIIDAVNNINTEDLISAVNSIDLDSNGIVTGLEAANSSLLQGIVDSLNIDIDLSTLPDMDIDFSTIDFNSDGIISKIELLTSAFASNGAINSFLKAIGINTAETVNAVNESVVWAGDNFTELSKIVVNTGREEFIFRGNPGSGGGGGSRGGGGFLRSFADGGIVTHPMIAEIGEGGQPEAIIPLDDFTAQITKLEAKIVELTEVTVLISEQRSAEHIERRDAVNKSNDLIEESNQSNRTSRTEGIL